MSDVNESMVNDFFSDAGGLVDQDTGSALPDPSGQQHSQEPDPNAQSAKSNNQQNNPQQPALPNQQNQTPAQQQTFDKQFYEVDQKGNPVFNANKALEFFTTQNNSSFQYQGIASPLSAQPQQQQIPAQPQQPTQQDKPAWQIEFEENQKRREEARGKHTTYRSYLEEAIQKNIQGQAAFEYADRKADEAAELEFTRMQYETRYKREEEQKKKAEEEQVMRQIEPMSRVNLTKVYNDVGGEDKFNALVFGSPSPDGKSLVGGFGIDTINMLFDVQHQGQQLPKDPAQLQEKYKQWWTKFTSNSNNLKFVVDVAKARLQMAMWPQMVNHIQSVRDTNSQKMSQATVNTPSAINNQQGSREPDALSAYLGYDTV